MCRALSSVPVFPHTSPERASQPAKRSAEGDVSVVPPRVRVVRVRAGSHELLCVSAEPNTRSCIRAKRQATPVSRAPSLARVTR
jgi:hypothetical protein